MPDPDCLDCRGRGFVRSAKVARECKCVLEQRVIHYLTPAYGPDVPWDRDFRTEELEGRNVAVTNARRLSVSRFRVEAASKVKSFLLATGARYSHRTLTPTDIFNVLFHSDDRRGHADLAENIELLIIPFGADRSKSTLGQDVAWLLDKRRQNGRATWLLLPWGPETSEFNAMYEKSGLKPVISDCLASFVKLPISGLCRV